MVAYYHVTDVLLMPYSDLKAALCSGRPSCISSTALIPMKLLGTICVAWWTAQAVLILYLSDNSRISKGRYFIRYSFEFEIFVLAVVLLNRILKNGFFGWKSEVRVLLTFCLYLLQLANIKLGVGVVHPLTRKYFVLFAILPLWLATSQLTAVVSGRYITNSLLAFGVAYLLFLVIYLLKTDDIDLKLVSLTRNEDISDPRSLLVKLDTLLVLLREESLGDQKYSVMLEGILREYQEYGAGEEVDLLNNFRREETRDKHEFFKKRRAAILRLLSLYYMKGISRHTDCQQLRFSFVYFMFDFLGLKNQAIQFLSEMQGLDMNSSDFFKWIIVKAEIEAEILQRDQESKKDKSVLNRSNQKLKYDHLVSELERVIVKVMEFWKIVGEENTKVRVIRDLLMQLTQSIEDLQDYWRREEVYLSKIPKCQVVYGLFLREVINRVNEGDGQIKAAHKELQKQQAAVQNFKEIDENTSTADLELALVLVKLTKNLRNCFIEDCTLTFAKALGADKRSLLNTRFEDYLPEAVAESFFQSLTSSPQLARGDNIDHRVMRFPFISFGSKVLKDFFFEGKLITDSSGEQTLAISLTANQDYLKQKFILNANTGAVKHMNSCFVAEHLNPSLEDTVFDTDEPLISSLVRDDHDRSAENPRRCSKMPATKPSIGSSTNRPTC